MPDVSRVGGGEFVEERWYRPCWTLERGNYFERLEARMVTEDTVVSAHDRAELEKLRVLMEEITTSADQHRRAAALRRWRSIARRTDRPQDRLQTAGGTP